jgi:AAA domain
MHLVCIFGPPAVGKMTVGHELARLTGFRLFHNHMTVDPVLDIFPFGSPPFTRLVGEFRRRIIEEAVAADLPGLVFTFVWGLESTGDRDTVASYVDIVERAGGRVSFVELAAPLEERLVRNVTEFRLDRKRSKRDVEFSQQNLVDLDAAWVMNTGRAPTEADGLLAGREHLRVDNTDLPAAVVARLVAEAWGLACG